MAYNSQFTGAQIDEAIAEVRSKKSTWDGKQNALITSGASVGSMISVAAVDANGKPTAWQVVQMQEVSVADDTIVNDVLAALPAWTGGSY